MERTAPQGEARLQWDASPATDPPLAARLSHRRKRFAVIILTGRSNPYAKAATVAVAALGCQRPDHYTKLVGEEQFNVMPRTDTRQSLGWEDVDGSDPRVG